MITSWRKKQIGSCLKNCLRKDLFLWYILIRRSKSYKLETKKKVMANEYYRKFTDLSRYHQNVAANRLRRFVVLSWVLSKVVFYGDHYPLCFLLRVLRDLSRIEENMPSTSKEEEEKNVNQRKDDKGKC